MAIDGEFEWDDEKAQSNEEKHDITFEFARQVFNDPFEMILEDADHSWNEARWLSIGKAGNEWLVISYTERGNKRRLISARRATRNERIEYQRQFE